MLTEEQLKIVDNWNEEKKQLELIMKRLKDNLEANVADALDIALAEINKVVPSYCEHGIVVVETCFDCEEIERLLEENERV